MEKRSAARELAFLVMFQLPQKSENISIDKLTKMDFHAICLSAIRTLADNARSNVNKAESYFIKVERSLMEHQINHPDNEHLDSATRSVDLPKTKEFFEHLDNCYQAIALIKEGLHIPELYWHYQDQDIQNFALEILVKYIDHREATVSLLKDISKSWDFNRIHKVDRKILELATTEIMQSDISPTVAVAEAIKLANKYSNPEGAKFINGLLADVIKQVTESV
jgi:transcription antitermination protein NusB